MQTSLDILDFSQVLTQLGIKIFFSLPARSLINKSLDFLILDDNLNVSTVVSASENRVLIGVAQPKKFEQLHPQVLQSVSVVPKQVEVVANCHEYFVEFGLFVSIAFHFVNCLHVLRLLRHFHVFLFLVSHCLVLLRINFLTLFNDEVVLASIVS